MWFYFYIFKTSEITPYPFVSFSPTSEQGPFGYRGEYGEKGIPGYPGARVSQPEKCAVKRLPSANFTNNSLWLMLDLFH